MIDYLIGILCVVLGVGIIIFYNGLKRSGKGGLSFRLVGGGIGFIIIGCGLIIRELKSLL